MLVTWIDSVISPREHSNEEAENVEPVILEDVGWLIAKTPKKVVIAATFVEEFDDVRNVTAIPRGMVRSIKSLKL